jgi:two-component system sensor histidine kinase KdpD
VRKKEWLPMQEIVGSALRHLARPLQGRHIVTSIPNDLPPVFADATALEQVLANLLDNAAEYTTSGSAIEISASTNSEGIRVEVADHGPGLPRGAEKNVFDKFFRAHPARACRRGIGLGLAICRGIIEAHGGTISAANRPGGGAAFTFTLPIGGTPPNMPEPV